jgi:hypothetical protein
MNQKDGMDNDRVEKKIETYEIEPQDIEANPIEANIIEPTVIEPPRPEKQEGV